MILIASSSSDTYITNKIIDSKTAVSGNVGRAGTLDLFKLYNESTNVANATEISRLLIKFDMSTAALLTSSTLKISDPTFNAKIKLRNISAGQPVPSNFTVRVFPLAVPFSEGFGRDVISFADVDSSNFLSRSNGSLWNSSGAFASGTIGDANVDYYISGNLLDGNGVVSLGSTQTFDIGTEDLIVDVTKVVSATIAGIIPDYGFRISFVDSQEKDSVTRFVKRFASRHVTQQSLRPSLTIQCDDSIVDNHSSSYFNVSSSLYVENIVRGSYSNFVSGSSLTQVTGSNSVLVKLSTGSFSKYVTGSQLKLGSFITGTYVANVAFYSGDESVITGSLTIKSALAASGSITFSETWSSFDQTMTYYSDFVTFESYQASTKSGGVRKLRSSMLSTATTAQRGQSLKIRAAFYDDYDQNRSAKFAYEPSPLITTECKIRVRDTISGELVFDFSDSGSKMSTDTLSNYYTLNTGGLPVGVPLALEFQITAAGELLQFTNKSYRLVLSE